MPTSDKVRLDQLLVERGLATSRSKAQALIASGSVRLASETLKKPGHRLSVAAELFVELPAEDWVSRGAHKLLHGLDAFQVDPKDVVCLDVGASTGGFTQVLLKRGAAKVYAVDVGGGQLALEVRADERVVSLEKTNARDLSHDLIGEPTAVIVCDVSFIGLEHVLPPAMALSAENASLVALIKPQFQAGPGVVGKGGVVRDPAVHQRVCDDVCRFIEAQPDWSVLGLEPSPIEGGDGNREFLVGARRGHSD